jgi:Uma2 family endonuclease
MKTTVTRLDRWSKVWRQELTPEAERRPLGEVFIEGYQKHPGRRMTEEEFVAWVGEKTRAEWVDGEVKLMSPVNREHDRIEGWIYRVISEYVDAKRAGQVCGSEFPVRFAGLKQQRITDVLFVSNEHAHRIKNTYFEGAPDMIVEVVSPDSTARDYREKFEIYETAGVREYWIVNPLAFTVSAFEWSNGKYRALEEKNGIIHSKVLKGFFLKPAWLWYDQFPRLTAVLREMGVK